MKHVVFLGPSLPREKAQEILPGCVCLPPVAQGDIASLCRLRRPEAIGIIDGVFRQSLSVWHKEILFALSLGVRVLGSSSMGALRAVECEPWGAEPVGAIAELVRDELVSDGDVAQAHAGAEHDFRALSLPIVNVIATLNAFPAEIEPGRRDEILAAARGIFYADRTWPTISKAANCTRLERQTITSSYVDQKAIDATHLLEVLKAPEGARPGHDYSRNVFKGFGRVLQQCDVRIPCPDKRARRAYEIGNLNAWCADQAADRALAIELARGLGLDRDLPDKVNNEELAARLNLLPGEYDRFAREELMLSRARLWLRSLDSGHDETPRRLNYLRSIGLYSQAKTGLSQPSTLNSHHAIPAHS